MHSYEVEKAGIICKDSGNYLTGFRKREFGKKPAFPSRYVNVAH